MIKNAKNYEEKFGTTINPIAASVGKTRNFIKSYNSGEHESEKECKRMFSSRFEECWGATKNEEAYFCTYFSLVGYFSA